jgi:hypothetical protein
MTRGYFDDEEPSFRRYSSRGHGYPLSHDRELPPAASHGGYGGPRNHQLSTHERRNGESQPDQDSNSRPRSRIPVAVSSQLVALNHADGVLAVRSLSKAQDSLQWR